MSDNLAPQNPSTPAAYSFRLINRGGTSAGPYTPVSQIDVGGQSAESLLVLGQAVKTASLPVTLASDTGTLNVSQQGNVTIVGTGTFVAQVTGTVTSNAGTNLNTSALALEAGNLATLAGAVTSAKVQVNAAQINGVAPSMGNGVSGTGVLRVTLASDSTGQVAVSGNVTVVGTGTLAVQAAQSGTWNITNVSGTVSLPTGAATAAKQPALGTAGTASVDVISIQGIASMTAIKVDGSAVTQPVSGTFWQATQPVSIAANVTVVGTGTLAVQAAQSGTWSVRLQDGSGNSISSTSAALNVALLADATPATQAITAVDAVSTPTTGANSQIAITGTPTANSAASFAVAGVDTVNIQVTGTFSATIATEVSFDGGVTWFARGVHQLGTAYTVSSFVGTGTTGNFAGTLSAGGMTNVRVRCTAYTSGTATVLIAKSLQPATQYIANALTIRDATTQSQQLAIGSTGAAAANITQVAGASIATGHGTASGAIRVELPTDGTGIVGITGNVTVVGTGTFAAQVSGTVTANAGTNLNTSALALDASVNGLLVAQASTTSGQSGPLVQTATTTAAPTYTTAKTNPLNTTTGGALRSDMTTIAGTAPTTAGKIDVKGADGDVFVRQTTAANFNCTVVGTGTFTTQAVQSGTWTVQPGNTANTTAWLVAEQAATAGGYSVSSFLSTAAVQTTVAKASAGQVYALHFFNNSATIAYVRLYNQTGAPASTDTANIVYRAMVPANTNAAGLIFALPAGVVFSTGIGYRVTAAIADNDTTALAANVVMGNVFYK